MFMKTFQPSLLVSSRCGSLAACPTPSCITKWRQDSLRSHQSSLSGRFCPNAPANMFSLLLHKNLLRTLTDLENVVIEGRTQTLDETFACLGRRAKSQVFVVFVSVLANVINVRRDTLRACFIHGGNDHLLGAQEPPSAIISLCSMFVVRDMSQSL